jgi:hypothetical protein
MATKTSPKTPFGPPIWPWNHVPHSGHPTRPRCQEVATDQERAQGAALISEYRAAEKLSSDHNIESRSEGLRYLKGVGLELARREIAACNHDTFLAAEAKLAELRKAAYDLVEPIMKRLVKSLGDQLCAEALAAEARLTQLGLPLQAPKHLDLKGELVEGEFSLHSDMLCKAIWSQRFTLEKSLAGLSPSNAIPAVQFLLTSEESTPFQWV